MTNLSDLTQSQLMQIGLEALAKCLGPAGMLRFMQQYNQGSGDYTRDRDKILGNPTLSEIVAEIKARRQQAQVEGSDTSLKYTPMPTLDVSQLTQEQIRQMGLKALTEALGHVGMLRFMEQYDKSKDTHRLDRQDIISDMTEEEHILK
ncbi:hypothetical protein [Scytonema hofmannii]|uniref:hypothetical protein n=1 Tax=Scytonema hofmannii TaxID=34078 RepID=UPI00034AB3B2|nr:hypothetical protein [Scytonema hofmannii]